MPRLRRLAPRDAAICATFRGSADADQNITVEFFERAPAELSARVACLDANNAALDIVELGNAHDTRVVEAARIYFEVGARTGLDWMRQQVEQLAVEGPWQAVARTGLRDNALRIHRRLAERVLTRKERGTAQVRVTAWVDSLGEDDENDSSSEPMPSGES